MVQWSGKKTHAWVVMSSIPGSEWQTDIFDIHLLFENAETEEAIMASIMMIRNQKKTFLQRNWKRRKNKKLVKSSWTAQEQIMSWAATSNLVILSRQGDSNLKRRPFRNDAANDVDDDDTNDDEKSVTFFKGTEKVLNHSLTR